MLTVPLLLALYCSLSHRSCAKNLAHQSIDFEVKPVCAGVKHDAHNCALTHRLSALRTTCALREQRRTARIQHAGARVPVDAGAEV